MAAAPSPTPFEILRQQRHAAWLTDLTTRLEQLAASSNSADTGPLEILLFGSRARGDWDGLSDTDLLVVAAAKQQASLWVDRLLDAGLAQACYFASQAAEKALKRALIELGLEPP